MSLVPWLAETRPQSRCLPLQGPQTSVLQGKKSDLEFEQEFEQQIAKNKGEEGGDGIDYIRAFELLKRSRVELRGHILVVRVV